MKSNIFSRFPPVVQRTFSGLIATMLAMANGLGERDTFFYLFVINCTVVV